MFISASPDSPSLVMVALREVFSHCNVLKDRSHSAEVIGNVRLERIHGCILLMPELHCWVGDLDPRLATYAANGKVPHQKPGVMVGHLHAQGFFLEKLAKLEVGTGGKTSKYVSNRGIVSALL